MAKRAKKQSSPPSARSHHRNEAHAISPSTPASISWKLVLQVLIIVAAVLWIYRPVLHGDWLWDDGAYITDNPLLRNLAGLWKIWFEPTRFIEYYPISTSLRWVQWHLWGMDTFGYHLTNVSLHILSAWLVWRLLAKFGLRFAWLGGLLFAIHPVQVESVAWISELKNTLSLPPFLLAMIFYLDYDEQKQPRDYWLALGFFLVAMLCKITMAPFPVMILLHAWWKRSRIHWSDLKVSAPFFAVSLILGITQVHLGAVFHHAHSLQDTMAFSMGTVFQGGWPSRIALAGLSLAFYFFNCVWPVGLIPIYPKWPVDPPSLLQFLPWPLMAGIIYGLWTKRQGWGRHAMLGLGFFLVMLGPFTMVHWSFTWVMDHFLYIPLIGLIGLVVAGLGQLPRAFHLYGMGIMTLVIALLAWESHAYAKTFVNSEALWTYTSKYNPDAYPAHNNLGNLAEAAGRYDEAADQFKQTLRIFPNYAEAHCNLGIVLLKTGHLPEAMDQLKQALQIRPAYAKAHYNLGVALQESSRPQEAIEHYEQALQINPDNAEAHNNLGGALFQTGRPQEAIEHYEQALRIDPNNVEAHLNLGNVFYLTGKNSEAIGEYKQALRIDPDNAAALDNLGKAQAMEKNEPIKK